MRYENYSLSLKTDEPQSQPSCVSNVNLLSQSYSHLLTVRNRCFV